MSSKKPASKSATHVKGVCTSRRSPLSVSFALSRPVVAVDTTMHQSPKLVDGEGNPLTAADTSNLRNTESIYSEFSGFFALDRRFAEGLGPVAARVLLHTFAQLGQGACVAGGNTAFPFSLEPHGVVVRATKRLAPGFSPYMPYVEMEEIDRQVATGEKPVEEFKVGLGEKSVLAAMEWAAQRSAEGLNVYVVYVTRPVLSSNNRGRSEGANTPLQKVTLPDGSQSVVISSYAIRNALREAAPYVAEQLGLTWRSNRSRVHDAGELTVAFEAAPDASVYHDDFAFGFMTTTKARVEEPADGAA